MPKLKVREELDLVPYPKHLRLLREKVVFTSAPKIELSPRAEGREKLSAQLVLGALGQSENGKEEKVLRIGSLTTLGRANVWLTPRQHSSLLEMKSEQGYILIVGRSGITIVGKSPLGALYGAQTLLQLVERDKSGSVVPLVEIRDYPAVECRVLAPAISWYAGYGRVGFASQLWGWDQWRWFLDWCLNHKVNGLNLCIYGYYPFRFEEYPESILEGVEVRTWAKEIGEELTVRYTHPNVQREFLPRMIKYANARGISVYCYFGLNTFNGGYALAHPESRYYSRNPEKYRQFRYNLCPSREDTRKFLEASVRKLLSLGFNGIVFEESEGSGFCECENCKTAYYDKEMDSRTALHRANYELFNHLAKLIKEEDPKALVGVRMWRMGSEMDVDYLRENKSKIPSDTLIFWSNGIDYQKFKEWVEVFGPERIMGQDAELLGFSTLYAGLIYMLPEQYSNYVRYVDPEYEPSYPQTLFNDIRQYKQAAVHVCRGVTGYSFNWNGWEIAPLSLAQYGWNPSKFTTEKFLAHGYRHLFGPVAGPLVAKATLELPIVLETRVCEGGEMVPRDDPVSGGLAGLTSLQVPTRFGEGKGEIRALREDLKRAKNSLKLAQKTHDVKLEPEYRRSVRYLENAARRTISICRAGIEYRKALALEKRKPPPREAIISHLTSSLDHLEADYLVVKESTFDLTDEFYERIADALKTVRSRLDKWTKKS